MPSARATLWTLSFAMGLSSVAQSMLATAVPLLAVALGMAPAWVGVLVALPNVIPVALGMATGRWVDRGGAGRWLVGGVAGMATAPLLLALAPQAAGLALAQLLLGAFQMVTALASQSYVADATPRGSMERAYATYATFLSAGRLVGPVLVGVLIDAAGFRPSFAVAAAIEAAALAVVWSTRRAVSAGTSDRNGSGGAEEDAGSHGEGVASEAARNGSMTTDPPATDPPAPFGVREAWQNVGVQLAVLASSAVFVAISVRQAFLPVVLDDVGFSATEIGTLISLGGVASVTMRPLMPVVSRLLGGPARTLVVALAMLALAVGLLGVVSSFAAFALLSLTAGAATGFGNPLSIVTVAQHVGSGERGTALGVRMSSNRAAQLVAPVLVGALIGVACFA
ncbi:MAG: MFS transporter, partial [Trueperaceae bacterium]